MNRRLTAESIIGEAMRANPKLSGMEFPIRAFPLRIQRIITELHDSQGIPSTTSLQLCSRHWR